jgi:hypothetical protein
MFSQQGVIYQKRFPFADELSSGSIGACLDNLKPLWKMIDCHLLEHSLFSARKDIGLGDWRQ